LTGEAAERRGHVVSALTERQADLPSRTRQVQPASPGGRPMRIAEPIASRRSAQDENDNGDACFRFHRPINVRPSPKGVPTPRSTGRHKHPGRKNGIPHLCARATGGSGRVLIVGLSHSVPEKLLNTCSDLCVLFVLPQNYWHRSFSFERSSGQVIGALVFESNRNPRYAG
jgi:hypothetical protein